MVTKGSAAQTVRARRTSEDAVDNAPLKLKKKVLAGRGDHTSGSNSSPTSDASPTREHEHERSIYGHHDRTRLGPADSETTPRSRGHGPPPPPLPQTDSEQQHQHWQREREEGRGHEAAQSYANDGSRDEQTPSTPLVAIAPAKPGTMLPKDLIMAKYRVKPDAPKFLLMLYEILQHESNQVIRWAEDGLALQILDQANVTEKVLPKYFNHTNFHSFQRQLNYFGFRKWTKSKTDICTFSHPYFRRNQPELMHLIKRKKATRRAGANEQAELVYPTDGYTEGGASTSTSTSPAMTSAGPPKKLLPVSPSGKRRLAQDASEDGGSRGYPDSNGSKPSGSLPSLANHQAHLNNGDSRSSTSRTFLPSASTLTNAISPASGGAKKKAKTMTSGKSFHPPELAPSGPMPPPSMMADPAMVGVGMPPGTFPKGALPNLDLVRNRLIYRQPSPGSAPGPMPNFPNGFPIAQNQNSQQQPTPSTENNSHNMSTSSQSVSNSNAPSNDSTNSMFNNSFSDPVDILLRIKKSRAMSQDNTIVQSPQHTQGQVEGFASLQNFLLSQSMYTNRLESQLKLAVEENDALRHLLDAKQREVDSLLNERKMIQNENAVLTEDKNKLFEINRDLLSKLFPQ